MSLTNKMEWIYTQAKVSGQGSLALALIMKKKKERKKERTNEKWLFFKRLVLAYTIVLMNLTILVLMIQNLLEILIFTLRNSTKLPVLRYLGVCNVLHIWECSGHPYL